MNKKISVVLLILVLFLVGCSQADKATEAAAAEAPPTVTEAPINTESAPAEPEDTQVPEATQEPEGTQGPEETMDPSVPTFEEGPCPFDVPAGAEDAIDCGFVVVPEDHSDPSGPTIRLAMAILKDQSAEHQADPVMILHGGPGEKTVAQALGLAQILFPLHPNRDLIVFDQRGVGSSEPALECPGFVETYLDNLGEADPNVISQAVFDAWLTCRDHLLAEGINLSVYTTRQNAADVEAIRVALGYEQVNLYGASYGSHLAQAVMRDYPESIRSAVIASVYPLEKSLAVDLATTTSNAILRLMSACMADEACNTAYPNLQETLFEVIDRLNEDPVPVTLTDPTSDKTYDSYLTGDGVVGNLVTFLYLTDVIQVLPQAIYDVYEGDYELMTQLSSTKLALLDLSSRGVVFPTLCRDDLIGYTKEDLLDVWAGLPKQLVSSLDPEVAIEHSIFAVCEQWPIEEAEPWVREPVISDVPILVMGSEFDPVTPPEYGKLVADHMNNSYFFEFPGLGHDITVNECARSVAGDFVKNPGQAPDASCIDEMPALVFAVPTDAAEMEFEAYTNPDIGIQALVPVGWTEVQPGIFARSSPTVDMAVFQMAVESGISLVGLLEAMSEAYGLEVPPEIQAEREANDLHWYLYTFEVQGVPRDLALAERDGKVLILILRSAADEQAVLYEAVFLPLVDGLRLEE